MMLWINDFPAWHTEGLFPLVYVLSLAGRVQGSLPHSSHSAVALLLQLIAVCFLLLRDSTCPPTLYYLMPFSLHLTWTFVCWHLGCALIYAVNPSDSVNSLLLGDSIILRNAPIILCHLFSQAGAALFCSHN